MKLVAAALIMISGVALNAHGQHTRVVEGPVVLHSNIADQWGGHTFSYLLEGARALFWSATEHREDGKLLTALIGQHPKPGTDLPEAITRISFAKPDDSPSALSGEDGIRGINQPQMLRTPDGYLHVFIGVTHEGRPDYNPGKLHYYRSKNPEDASVFLDRSELIPTGPPYEDFHLRMNVGISPDGQRMVLAILAISEDGSVPFNTPVIFFGRRQGLDFVFQKPVPYAEPMGFFYPLIAATDDGIVLVGEVWDDPKRAFARLIHLDWSGKTLHREDLPMEGEGKYLCFDLRPLDARDWSRLGLYCNGQPAGQAEGRHDFWEYDVKARRLRLLNSVADQVSFLNAGKWIPLGQGSIFINNPSMGRLYVWEGDIAGGGKVTKRPLPGANPLDRGYLATAYLFAPNVLQGSIVSRNGVSIASDCFQASRVPETSGPCSFLMWRLKHP